MKTVRARFTCQQTSAHRYPHTEQTEVKLNPVQEGPFWDATPMGHLEMTITNKAAAGFFEPGKDYFLDFSVADE